MTVHIIEDDPILAEHFARVLKDFHPQIFTNVLDAIQYLDHELPQAIVLDILLDGPSGFSLLNELQSYPDTAVISVIICSNLTPEFSSHDLSGYGVVALLDKSTMLPQDLYYEVAKWIPAPKP